MSFLRLVKPPRGSEGVTCRMGNEALVIPSLDPLVERRVECCDDVRAAAFIGATIIHPLEGEFADVHIPTLVAKPPSRQRASVCATFPCETCVGTRTEALLFR
jgi:hypothetical protein